MVDLSDKGSSESEEMSSSQTLEIEATRSGGGGGGGSSQVKTCADCGTTKTPLWRGGPAGPKSLCNACGIRSRKRRRALLGLNKASIEEKKVKGPVNGGEDQKIEIDCSGNSSSSGNNKQQKKKSGNKLGESMKRKIQALGDEVVLQRSTMDKFRRKLGEEEQAAVLLMALSCGSFYV